MSYRGRSPVVRVLGWPGQSAPAYLVQAGTCFRRGRAIWGAGLPRAERQERAGRVSPPTTNGPPVGRGL